MPNDTFTPEQIAQILEEFFKVVGTRQYVGARYVPIFGRKGEESIEWDNTGTYEPLSIVLYQGNSYTSRQFVPVGVEITNQEFWALTGNYNAQVELYRRETAAAKDAADAAQAAADAAQDDIDTLLPKSDFSSESTVKDAIDGLQNDIDSAQDDIDTLLPKSVFSSESTVKDAIDNLQLDINAAQNDIDTLLPKASFSSSNTVKNYIDAEIGRISGVSYVGNYGAVENDDSVDWQSIFDAIADVSNTVDFGSGQWIINETIDVPVNIKAIVGAGATIKTTETVTTLLSVAESNPDYITNRFVVIVSGIEFFCNFNVNRVLYIVPSQSIVSDCTFKDFNDVGVEFTSAGSGVRDSSFIISQNGETFTNTTVGVKLNTDSYASGCKFFALHRAIEIIDTGRIENNYFWIGTLTNAAYCVYGKVAGGGEGVALITFLNNETDGYPYIFYNCSGIVQNNFMLYNGIEVWLQNPWSIFQFESSSQRFLDFSNNIIYFVYGFQHELHTFYGTHAYDGVLEYVSLNNTIKNSRNEVVQGFSIGFGSATMRNINYGAVNLLTDTIAGLNISYQEYFNNTGVYTTCISDASNNINMSISNTQGSAAFPLTPELHKNSDGVFVITLVRRGGGFNNIISRGTRALFEFIPAPENLTNVTETITVTKPHMTV